MDRTRTRAARWAVGVALVAAVLSGCAKPGTQTPGSGGTVHPSTTPSGFSLPPTGKPRAAPEMTISGVMRAGVEANCMVLATADGTQYQLLGGEQSIYRACHHRHGHHVHAGDAVHRDEGRLGKLNAGRR
jgi:hypothetical protein